MIGSIINLLIIFLSENIGWLSLLLLNFYFHFYNILKNIQTHKMSLTHTQNMIQSLASSQERYCHRECDGNNRNGSGTDCELIGRKFQSLD